MYLNIIIYVYEIICNKRKTRTRNALLGDFNPNYTFFMTELPQITKDSFVIQIKQSGGREVGS